jgi:hypothetical protein
MGKSPKQIQSAVSDSKSCDFTTQYESCNAADERLEAEMTERDLEQQSPKDSNSMDVSTNEPTTPSPAKMSTGPRTANGKAIASKNALKHGIYSNAILLKSESRSDYDSLLIGLREYFAPVGMFEEFLVEKAAVLIWRHRRLVTTETAELEGGGFTLDFDSKDSNTLNRFPRYEASIDRALDRTLAQLERYQRMRLGQPVAPLIKVDVSSS